MLKQMRLLTLAAMGFALPGCATFCKSCEEMHAEIVSLSIPAKAPDSLVRDVEHKSEFAAISGDGEHVICWNGKCPVKRAEHDVFWLFFAPDPFVDPLGLKDIQPDDSGEGNKSVVSQGVVGKKNFAFDDAKLTGNLSVLEKVLASVEACDGCEIDVVGHTDSVGRSDYNDALGLKRANAVKNWLVSKGIESSRITIGSRGEKDPIASNKTAAGRYENRRAAYKVTINLAEKEHE
jgi:outer membrane protein OmpA-like peptidoglycan-associated protein